MEVCSLKITSFQNFDLILKFQKVLMFFEVILTRQAFWTHSQKKFSVKRPCFDATKSTSPLSVDVETVPLHESVRTSFWAWKLPLQSDPITRKKFGTPLSLSSTLKFLHCWGRPPSEMVWIVTNHTSFLLSCLEVWRICAVAYESFGTQKQTI